MCQRVDETIAEKKIVTVTRRVYVDEERIVDVCVCVSLKNVFF